MGSKLHVILDTDAANECDDQFALAYLLKQQDRVIIDAITTAPYSHQNETIENGQPKSLAEVTKICHWSDFSTTDKVYQGALSYTTNNHFIDNPAVQKIVAVARLNTLTHILAIGAPTNIAIAIHNYPDIIPKIKLIWLGSNGLMQTSNQDFNFRQDLTAVREIFGAHLDLTVIPCANIAALLMTSIYELRHHLDHHSELCNYLLERFYNDTYHGIQERRVIWDISAIAYLLHPEWYTIRQVNCPEINDDTSFKFIENQHQVNFATNLEPTKILNDLWTKLAE